MPRFFFDPENRTESRVQILGEDAGHIARVLRMNVGDPLELCDGCGFDYEARITALAKDAVTAELLSRTESASEPQVEFVLFQGLSKGDRMETVIQKAVELGVAEIVPVEMKRSVAKGDKLERWQKIATAAAKQSGRGRIPRVSSLLKSKDVVDRIAGFDLFLLPYEGGGRSLRTLLEGKSPRRIGIWIGPEGGFDEAEVASAKGAQVITLGKRILRTETAGPAVLAALSYALGEWE